MTAADPARAPAPAQVPAGTKTPPGGWAPAKLLAKLLADPPVASGVDDVSSGVVVDDANDEESAPTRVDEAAPSASTVANIAASIDHDDSPSTVTAVAYDAAMSTYVSADGNDRNGRGTANGGGDGGGTASNGNSDKGQRENGQRDNGERDYVDGDGGSTVNARPIRVPSESGEDAWGQSHPRSQSHPQPQQYPHSYSSPLAAADASADIDFDDPVSRESAPALPPPPAEHGGGFGSRPSTNNDDVTGVDMPFGGRAQSNVSTIFGDPAGAMTYPPNTWPTGSRLVQTRPGLLAKLLASPKRLAIIGGSAALCLVIVYMIAFRGSSSTPTVSPATQQPVVQQPVVQQPVVQQPVVQQPAVQQPAPAPVVETGSAATPTPTTTTTTAPTPPPPTRPKTVVKKSVVKKAATKPTTTKSPPKRPATTKPKKPAWDPDSLFPTKRK